MRLYSKSFLFAVAPLVLLPASAADVRVIVGFYGDADAGVFGRHGGATLTELPEIRAVAGKVPSGRLAALRKAPGVAYVEEDLVREANATPNDPYFETTFSKRYEKRGYNDQREDFELINAPEAWDISKGAGVRVAVLDSGIDAGHPDLSGKVNAWRNFTASGNSTVMEDDFVTDNDGHGTHTAGTVAAETNNGSGVAGMGWDADLAVGKVLGPEGGYDSWIAAGILWGAGEAPIISMSLGGEGSSTTLDNAVETAWESGALLVAAAGNDGVDGSNHYPSAHPDVVAVAAVDEDGAWADFSNYGPTIEIAAPGVNVLSTFPGGYGWSSGTSMACPHVSGVAALVWAFVPDQNDKNALVRARITAGGSLDVTAPDDASIGVLDAAAALAIGDPGPTVTITAPDNGVIVSGDSVGISADATASGTVSQVEFFVDGASVGVDTDSPYNAVWDSMLAEDGPYTITAKVTDDQDRTGSDSVVVTLDNVDDAPGVTITSPSEGETVSGSVAIAANASDDRGISQVEFFVNGEAIGMDFSFPYDVMWDSTLASDGQHTFTAVATDSIGQSDSDSITATVANAPSSLTVSSMSPDSVSSGASVAVTILGAGFEPGATVTFENGSGPTPVASNVLVSSTTSIAATISVKRGGPRRSRTWDLRVTLPGGDSATLNGGFRVIP